jgi:IS30 family transposase
MNTEHHSKTIRKGKHFNRNDKLFLESIYNNRVDIPKIAAVFDVHISTIYRELKHGKVTHLRSDLTEYTTYSAERSITLKNCKLAAKDMPSKQNNAVLIYIADKIINEYKSPDVIHSDMVKENYKYTVTAKTIYNWVDQGIVPGVTNSNLWEKTKRKAKSEYNKIAKTSVPPDKRIDNRPSYINDREEFGHWEMDLIVGGKGCSKHVLLTLVERKTRRQIVTKLPNKKQCSVSRATNKMEKEYGAEQFKKIFKTITVDNGTEFKHYNKLERSIFNKKEKRTTIYYAHPYSSWERGSNENGNRFIRRFIDKGSDIDHYTKLEIEQSIEWINNYPRKVIGYKTAEEYFNQELLAA